MAARGPCCRLTAPVMLRLTFLWPTMMTPRLESARSSMFPRIKKSRSASRDGWATATTRPTSKRLSWSSVHPTPHLPPLPHLPSRPPHKSLLPLPVIAWNSTRLTSPRPVIWMDGPLVWQLPTAPSMAVPFFSRIQLPRPTLNKSSTKATLATCNTTVKCLSCWNTALNPWKMVIPSPSSSLLTVVLSIPLLNLKLARTSVTIAELFRKTSSSPPDLLLSRSALWVAT
mmetsp:Transcript_39795/g.82749  ORF Transcript_39795/g.82749 Transcript_39795/m.82749 type:complete len:228 (+) Transcript_39795:1823-2506(+)